MGLAAALKRRLGGGDQQVSKRPRAEPAVAAPARAPAANGRLPATRSARRQQNKTRRQQAEQQQAEEEDAQRQASESEGEEEAEAEPLAADAAAGGAAGPGPATAAYQALLASLKDSNAEFAARRREREREEAGVEDEESSEEEESEVEDDDGSKGEEGASEGDAGEPAADASDEEEAGGSDSEAEEEEEEHGDEAASEDEGDGGSDEEQQQQALQPNGAADAAAGAAPAAAAVALEDHYLRHFDHELPGAEAAALQAGAAGAGAPRAFEPRLDAPKALAQWRGAQLQATAGAQALPSAPSELAAYGVKERLATRWKEAALAPAQRLQQQQAANGQQRQQQGAGGSGKKGKAGAADGACGDFASPQQRTLFALLSSYSDLMLPCRPYATEAAGPDPEMDAVLLHVLSHCAKAADRIKRNNDRIKAAAEAGETLADPPRDQGFTRPKALILLPLRSHALRWALRLAELAVRETRSDSVQGKAKLLADYGGGEEEEDLPPRAAAARASRPAEHTALFSGNMDDHFRLGVKLTRGAVRLFSEFYQSDIIIASPVALATKLAEGEEGGADFLSSIEICVVERADVLQMQNWEHVRTVFGAMNRLPAAQRGVDIMRVRTWALSGWGALYRQTVLLSSFASPEMNALLSRGCANYAGCLRLKPGYPGVLQQVIPQLRQVFERISLSSTKALASSDCAASDPGGGGGSVAAEADARLEHFKRTAWPRLKEGASAGGQLVYVPSYFDFVRVRNFLKAQKAEFLALSEYASPPDAARARSYFFSRRRPLLLLTERSQFYHRYRIRGIKDIFFYQLPEHPQFYSELLNLGDEEGGGGVHALFSRLDAPRLERIVGSERSQRMLAKGAAPTFLFC